MATLASPQLSRNSDARRTMSVVPTRKKHPVPYSPCHLPLHLQDPNYSRVRRRRPSTLSTHSYDINGSVPSTPNADIDGLQPHSHSKPRPSSHFVFPPSRSSSPMGWVNERLITEPSSQADSSAQQGPRPHSPTHGFRSYTSSHSMDFLRGPLSTASVKPPPPPIVLAKRKSFDALELESSPKSPQPQLMAVRSLDLLEDTSTTHSSSIHSSSDPDKQLPLDQTSSPVLPASPSGHTPSMRLSFDTLDRRDTSTRHSHSHRRSAYHVVHPASSSHIYQNWSPRDYTTKVPSSRGILPPKSTATLNPRGSKKHHYYNFNDADTGATCHMSNGHVTSDALDSPSPSSLFSRPPEIDNWYAGASQTSLTLSAYGRSHKGTAGYLSPIVTNSNNNSRHYIIPPHHQLRHDVLEHQVSSMGHSSLQSSTREPNLNDVIDYLSSSNPANVINAASYLQHLAYGDDSMKSKIRQYGGIPSLISQLRSHEGNIQVQTAILGALRNLSYGRINVENKKQIASDAGLPELGLVLKTTRHSEVKELVTSVLWNLSSCDDIKLRILQVCLKDLVQFVILPHSGYSYNSLAAKDFTVRPSVFQWSPEMRNTLGALRNISSAGEDTRKILRVCPHLVDSLMWIVRAATGQEDTDEKTAENAMCILRNLSYRLEYEVDLLDGSQDHLDEDWERQILSEIDDSKQEEKDDQPKGRSSGFLSICARPRTADNLRRSVPRLSQPSNLISPDPSLIPRRVHAVTGVSLLWQPEVIFPYLALLEKFTSTPELIEAAAGAVQNLTACAWKWSVFIRHLVRKTRGLTLLIELLNHSHDTVVRAAATALRNLAVDYPNKRMIGIYGIQNIIPRLPYGQNSLGISEQTTIALLCALMELTLRNSENARVFRENSGIGMIVKLTRSKDHTPRIIYAAHKLCSILHDLKITKPGLKQEGWDIKEYQRLSADTNNTHHLEFERGSFANTELRRSGRGGSVNEGSSKDKKGRKKSSEDISATTTTTAVPQPTLGERRGSQPTMLDLSATNRSGGGGLASTSGSFPKLSNTTTVIADTVEPGYQMIDIAKQPKPSTNQNHQQAPPIPPAPQPIGMYAEINDPGLASLRRGSDSTQPAPPRSDSRTHSHSDHSQPRSEPRSSPIEHHTTTGSTSDEDKPGTALYAQVDMEKKRASRKQKQQGSNVYREEIVIRGQQPPPTHPVTQADDSWV